MTRHTHGNAPFDDVTDESHARFAAHMARTYQNDPVIPQVGQVWHNVRGPERGDTIEVLEVFPDYRIPYARVRSSRYGESDTRLLVFGRNYQLVQGP
jgi:hypothetical protein